MKKVLFLGFFLFILLIPVNVWAVEFSIEATDITAQLHEDGRVDVKESHTYEFDGDFNGITRRLISKEKTTIKNFQATENGKELKVEKDGDVYKVYRGGSDETVTVDITYTITNGVERFEDVAQFYYPFFDESNETTYENMTITVVPPKPADVKAAYGYDEAYDAVETIDEGTVVFNLGEVSSEENGDIRVAYDASLFSEATLTAEMPMLGDILADQEKTDAEVTAEREARERWGGVAPVIVGGLLLIVIVLLVQAIRRKRLTGIEIERQISGNGRFPDTEMSLPAILLFTGGNLKASAVIASLLELVRNENIKKISDEEFELVNRDTDFKHETRLIEWLFDDIASSHIFHVKDLESYVEEKKNHEKYQRSFSGWKEAVRREYKQYDLTEKAVKTRWISGLAALGSFISIFLFAYHELFLWMLLVSLLFLFFLIFPIAYRPLNEKGRRIMETVTPLKVSDQWKEWDQDEQVQALLYQIGAGKRKMSAQFASTSQNNEWMIYLLLAETFQSGFEKADQHTAVSAAGSSGGGGSGVGGGGGGSGAF
ncbi:DUF2207 domain-containing protein [Alkalihalobacillus hwajinpoensis]|uniref:DUF2207 domain-containing protein n=1 Tax=Guptibacillus hwajinpoensis TaxID=208199 RepID=UPI0018843524|nr:DUF2207 domain-containing protein [Pseudalkalibacillus hwajinpoensis]MBF0705414.1 DUF2207 domain-containing protein [Pseudalkalibacillus hwajinpoensis]